MLALKKHFDERARLTSPDFGLRGPQRFDVIPAEPPFLLLTRREILIMHGVLSVPSLLLRRFVFRMVEASAKRRCGEPQGTMGRVQTPVVSLPPSFARTFSSRERRLGTRQERSIDY